MMYAIRNKKTGRWYVPSLGKQWRKCPNKDSLFWTKNLAREAVRLFDIKAIEIIPVKIVEACMRTTHEGKTFVSPDDFEYIAERIIKEAGL